MTAPVFGDVLGPRGRRRTLVASIVAAVGVAALLLFALRRLQTAGQLDAALWKPFTQGAIWRFLAVGLRNTLKAAAISMALSIVFGFVLALGRLSRNRPIRWVAGAWVEFFRGVPLILMILFAGLGLPKYGIDVALLWYLVLGLVLYNSAILGEIFRAGILSLDRGQREAALAVGLTDGQAMRLVILPQAFRRMVPAIVSQCITLLKDTSLGFVISYEELLRRGYILAAFSKNILQSIFVVALLYIAVNLTLSRLARRLEVRQRDRLGAGAIQVGGVEDLAVIDAQARGARGG
jgi:glutamate transport system permease protein